MPSTLSPRLSRYRAVGELRLLDRYRTLGMAGATALAVGGVAAGALPNRDPFAGVPLVGWLRSSEALALAVGYAGLALLVVAWLFLGRRVGTPDGPNRRSLLITLAVWAAPLSIAPPMFSRDVYSYAAQGWMVHVGASPYFWGPGAIPQNPFLVDVPAMWSHTPAPYGPAFLQLARWIVDLGSDETVPTVLGMRLLALAGVLLLVRYVPRLAEHCGVAGDRALWLGVLNPLVLFHFVSGAHNDSLLVGLLVAGLVFVLDRRPALGVAVCALALLVKAPAALALVFIVPVWAQQLGGRLRLARAAAAVATVSGAVVVSVSWLTGLGYGWVNALNTPGTVRNWLSGTTLLGEGAGLLTQAVGLGDQTTEAIKVFRGAGGLVALVICLLLLARIERYGLVGSLGLGFIAVVALGPVVHPWYLLWGFVLVAAGIPALGIRSAVITVSAALSMVLMPKGGTVDVSAIVQAVLSAAAVAGSAVLFELLPGRPAYAPTMPRTTPEAPEGSPPVGTVPFAPTRPKT